MRRSKRRRLAKEKRKQSLAMRMDEVTRSIVPRHIKSSYISTDEAAFFYGIEAETEKPLENLGLPEDERARLVKTVQGIVNCSCLSFADIESALRCFTRQSVEEFREKMRELAIRLSKGGSL